MASFRSGIGGAAGNSSEHGAIQTDEKTGSKRRVKVNVRLVKGESSTTVNSWWLNTNNDRRQSCIGTVKCDELTPALSEVYDAT